jgi:hypothetical protein
MNWTQDDVRRTGMTAWQFSYNWFIKWQDEEWDRKCLGALFNGK